jgi:ATP-dependent Clp protease protease subunit
MNKFWNLSKKDNRGELYLYGDISSTPWSGDEITPKQFKADLDELGDIADLDIYINSGGGDVFAGQAIKSILDRHSANKTVYIDGIAASIASVIAMAGNKIIISKNGMMMIHKAWSIASGNSDKFRKFADDMDKIDESISMAYVDKTGKSKEELIELMQKETWMTAEDAVRDGFADEIATANKLAASIDGEFLNIGTEKIDLSRFENKELITGKYRVQEVAEPVANIKPENPVTENQITEKLQAQQQEFFRIKKKII